MLLRLSSMPLVLAYSVQSFNHRNLSLAIDQTRLNSVNLPSMHPHIKKGFENIQRACGEDNDDREPDRLLFYRRYLI
jgi:hypothetical protein